jgi:hypothetical protein
VAAAAAAATEAAARAAAAVAVITILRRMCHMWQTKVNSSKHSSALCHECAVLALCMVDSSSNINREASNVQSVLH